MKLLKAADPIGNENRKYHKLKRREYRSKVRETVCALFCDSLSSIYQGPNFCWHMDGYDKLKPFGFAVHGCIDGLAAVTHVVALFGIISTIMSN